MVGPTSPMLHNKSRGHSPSGSGEEDWTPISYGDSLGWGTKVCSNGPGHMTKMAATPIYVKNPLKIFFSRTRTLMTLGLGMKHWESGAYQVCSNDDPMLIMANLMSRSNLHPNTIKWDFFLKSYFLNTFEALVIILTWYVKNLMSGYK